MSETRLSEKQQDVWEALENPNIYEVFAGGSAGGGKSFFGCTWQIARRITYPGTRGFIGRETFTGLQDSTMKTYFQILQNWGYKSGVHFSYNAQQHTITYKNGSEQHFRHMAYQPSDPDYNRFGSTEYTDGFIDEAPEVDKRAAQVLYSRMRYKHVEYGLTPSLLYTGNPGDHWIKYDFVQDEYGEPITPAAHRKTILFTIKDNPDKAFAEAYAKTLEHLDDYDRDRLLHGDWNAKKNILRPFAHAYDEKIHVADTKHNPMAMTMVLVDFNVDPYCANIFNAWKDENGSHCHQVDEIEFNNGTIQEMAERIKSSVGQSVYSMYLGGDAMGNNRTIGNRDNKSLFAQLVAALGINSRQLKIVANPGHGTSRTDVNYFLKNYPDFKVGKHCTGTRRDLRSVEVDAYGSIMKKNRKDESQRADFLDNVRYLVNTFFKQAIQKHQKTGQW